MLVGATIRVVSAMKKSLVVVRLSAFGGRSDGFDEGDGIRGSGHSSCLQ